MVKDLFQAGAAIKSVQALMVEQGTLWGYQIYLEALGHKDNTRISNNKQTFNRVQLSIIFKTSLQYRLSSII
jgi:hypothetical protein